MLKAATVTLVCGSITALFGTSAAEATHVRPAGASPLRVSLVPAYDQCTLPNAPYSPPTTESCGPPTQSSNYLTLGTNDANGKPTKSAGFARFVVVLGDTSTPENEADIGMEVNITDVRCREPEEACSIPPGQSGHEFSDYEGSLRAFADDQRTDHRNGATAPATALGDDLLFNFDVPCSPTNNDSTVGSTCSATTTANTLIPGQIVEKQRNVVELRGLEIWDGGADGNPDTQPSDGSSSELFEVQGVFVP
jgi:hypothetical protein